MFRLRPKGHRNLTPLLAVLRLPASAKPGCGESWKYKISGPSPNLLYQNLHVNIIDPQVICVHKSLKVPMEKRKASKDPLMERFASLIPCLLPHPHLLLWTVQSSRCLPTEPCMRMRMGLSVRALGGKLQYPLQLVYPGEEFIKR